jgi:hypothetical protein
VEPFGEITRASGGLDRDLIAVAYRERSGDRLRHLIGNKLIRLDRRL